MHLRRATQLVGSTITGSLAMLDTRTPEISIGETVLAHTGGISQLETEGNYIVTIGYTMRSVLHSAEARFARAQRLTRPLPTTQTRHASARSVPEAV